jgi:TM2 domain-containing membrane protein YozV
MDAQKVDMYLMMNNKYFEGHHLNEIREKLLSLDEAQWQRIQFTQFKDPTTALLISIFAGVYGIDRFYIGDTGMGVGKLLTCGGFGVWAIVDWFLIQGATKEKNIEAFFNALI